MKKILTILIFCLLAGITSQASGQAFYRHTKHKPLKGRMKKAQIKRASHGKNFYFHSKGKVVKRGFFTKKK